MVIIAGTVTTRAGDSRRTPSSVEITSQGADDDFEQETGHEGEHTITFTRPFGAAPSVVASAHHEHRDMVAVVRSAPSADSVTIHVRVLGENLAPYGYSFSFIAVGVAGAGEGGGPA